MDETFGRYRLLERLGQGGMAEVFKAMSFGVEGFEKTLVIKRILPELAKSKRFSDLFVHEAKLAVRLSHANVVQVFDLGTAHQAGHLTYYIAMEYVAGLDLATLIARCRDRGVQFPPAMCVYIAGEVAKGLDHAHRRRDEQMHPLGIVHRDVSPHNILISWEGEIKVTDFGIAKARDSIAEEGELGPDQLQGKYPYMSPEQARGQSVDARSDLFSLGIVLYEMLTFVNPFRAPTTFETLRRVKAVEYPPTELLRPDLPSGLVLLLEKALALSVDKRFPDAGRMYESLLAYLYSSGDRFGANDLAQFMNSCREAIPSRPPSIKPDADSDEMSAAPPVHTPVEVPSQHRISPVRLSDYSRVSELTARASGLGERREVTALVLRWGGRAPVKHEHHDRVRDILARYGAHLLEDEPSHVAALFGLGQADGRDTETAVRCALVALRRMGISTPSAESEPTSNIPPSAGIHAGRVLISPHGEPSPGERLTALLATAQEMARLSPRRCGISVSAARSVRGQFLFESPPETPEGSAGTAGLLATELTTKGEGLGRFIGRKSHLKRFGEIFSLATRKRISIVNVVGTAGVGKTRLLYEIGRRLRKGDYKVAFYLATCPPSGGSVPLSGLTAMLQVLCGTDEGDVEERILEVEPRLRALGLRDDEVAAVLFQLGATSKRGSNLAALRSAVSRMVLSLSTDQLHVFAWDNTQALDAQSIEIIENTVWRLGDTRSVFVFASREGSYHPLESHPNHELIELNGLDENESHDLIAQRAGSPLVPLELIDFCRERAKGQPLFIEEIIKELSDRGALVVANGRVVELHLDGEVSVPRPLRALIAARVARLAEEERRLLQAASILGEPVDLLTLGFMLGETIAKVETLVAALAQKDFLRHDGPAAVVFSSPLFAEIITDALPLEARREMHAAAGAACEARLGPRVAEYADRVATHFFEAGDRDRAAAHFARSGQRNLLGKHYDGAVRDTLRALELCDLERHSASELGAWLSQLTAAVYRVRAAREVPDLMNQVLAQIDRTGDTAVKVAARVDLGSILISTHSFEQADRYLADAKVLAHGSPALVRSTLLTEAELARRRGDWRKAMDRFEELEKLGIADKAQEHRIQMGLGLAYAASGAIVRARQAVAKAEGLASQDDLALSCERAKLEQLIAIMGRDNATAVVAGQRAVELARVAGLTYEEAINLHILGQALFRKGNHPVAYASFQQSSALCDELSEERLRAHNRSFLAYLDSVSDRTNTVKTLGETIGYAHAHGYSWDEVNARFLLAKVHLEDGQADAARAEFTRCRSLADATGFRLMVDDCADALASIERSARSG